MTVVGKGAQMWEHQKKEQSRKQEAGGGYAASQEAASSCESQERLQITPGTGSWQASGRELGARWCWRTSGVTSPSS